MVRLNFDIVNIHKSLFFYKLMQNFKKLSYLLSSNERRRAFLLLVMILLMALIDMLGIASIVPFIAILTSPELIDTNVYLSKAYQIASIIGINTKHEFLIAVGIAVFFLLIFSLTFKALTTYFQTRFIKMCEYNISKRLFFTNYVRFKII